MKLVALKIQQQKLGLSDARYRKLLNDIGGVRSSKELCDDFNTLVILFDRLRYHHHVRMFTVFNV